MPLQHPNYESFTLTQATCSTAGDVRALGFNATYLKLLNTEAVDWYVDLKSTSAADATTGDMRVRACSEVVLPSLPPVAALAAYTTSTSASAKLLYVTALGEVR